MSERRCLSAGDGVVRGRNRMKHRKTVNHGCKKIPIQMGLSIKSKFVGLYNYKFYGVEKCRPASESAGYKCSKDAIKPCLASLMINLFSLMIPLKVSRLFLIELT